LGHPKEATLRRRALSRAALALVLVALAPCLATAQTDATRLGRDVLPTFESVRLGVDPARPEFTGTAHVELKVVRATSTFALHAEGPVIAALKLRGPAGDVGARQVPGGRGVVRVQTDRPLAPGAYTLDLEFKAPFDPHSVGLYRTQAGADWYAFTQFEATDARRAFPCWDEPSFKIPYQLTLTVPAASLAVSNTPVESETPGGASKTVVFKRTPPLPSYLLALAVGPFDTVPIAGMSVPGRVVTVKGKSALAAEAARVTPPLLAALETYFGRPYPYEKLDVLALPEFWPGAMENAGAITFRDSILLLDPGRSTASQKKTLSSIMAHELAHMWFGDLVTMEWWDDLWLNESFASWMGDKVTQETFPETNEEVSSVQAIQNAMLTDARLTTRAIRQPVTNAANLLQSADALAYDKGEAVLGMVEAWLGPDAFRRGVLDYMTAHEWKNARAEHLWSALSKASGKDVKAPLTSFLDQPGVPLVSAEIAGPGKVRLTQRRFLNHGTTAPAATWQIPVGLRWSTGGAASTTTVVLTQPTQTFSLPTSEPLTWLHPNAGERGYYRWHVPRAALTGLAEKGRERLTPRERVGFVGNLAALLDAGDLRGHDYLRLLGSFAADPDPQVLAAVVTGLNRTRTAFVTPELAPHFATYVRNTLGPALERIGPTPKPGEPETVSILRPQLMLWLGREGHDPKVLAQAVSLTATALVDPSSADPALLTPALQLAAAHGDRALFGEFQKRFEAAKVPAERNRYLAALAAFEDPALIDEALKYSLTPALRPQEVLVVTFSLTQRGSHLDTAMQWVTSNYDVIAGRVPPVVLPFLVYAGGGCSAERLATARTFFGDPRHQAPGTDKELAKLSEAVKDCLALRAREGAGVKTYLTGFAPVR
jgi:alanyl aminopeptidase